LDFHVFKYFTMRTSLIILLAAAGLVTLTIGMLLISFADTAEVRVLDAENEYFRSGTSFFPGTVLIVSGTLCTVALLSLLNKNRKEYGWSLAAGISVTTIVTSQLIMTGLTHWLQIILIGIGVLIMLLSLQLSGRWVA